MDILDKFIEKAKENVASGYYKNASSYSGKRHSLLKKLQSQNFSLIAEIKHASPAGEYSFDYINVKKTAIDFLQSGADAISVVVEPQIFKGHLHNVTEAKVAGLPVLFKDFIFTQQQIDAAANAGADAVLLIVKVADRVGFDLNELISYSHKKGLEVLLETYDGKEMQLAAKTDADILGINNRDLRTLKVDISCTGRILEAAGKLDKPVISESGIKTSADVSYVKRFGIKGVLVGTAIWKAKDIKEKIRELKSG